MSLKIDIDALLADDQIEITLLGKTYILKDISMPAFLKASKMDNAGPETIHEQLAMILGVDPEEIKDLGLKASGLAIEEIQKWVLQGKEVDGEASSENP